MKPKVFFKEYAAFARPVLQLSSPIFCACFGPDTRIATAKILPATIHMRSIALPFLFGDSRLESGVPLRFTILM
jgi:hypothetical protein